MTNRTTTFVVGALTFMIAGASMLTMHPGHAGAADECLAAPKAATPAGQHWYYRLDHGTKRRCWYLGNAGQAALHAVKSTSARRVAPIASRDGEAALPRSVANVHAEMPMPQGGSDDAPKIPAAPASQAGVEEDSTGQGQPGVAVLVSPTSPVVARAPDPTQTEAAASEPSKPTPAAEALTAADAKLGAKLEAAAVAPPAAARDVAAVTASGIEGQTMVKPISVGSLFLAAFGVLVLVTLATGLAYLFMPPARRRRSQSEFRASHLDDWSPEPFRISALLEPAAYDAPATTHAAGAPERRPGDDDVRRVERLLSRAVRRSETLRGRTSPGTV